MPDPASFVWLPGWSASPRVWRSEVERWPRAAHTTVDFSECASPDSFVRLARRAVCSAEPPALVVGWSLGAMIALEVARSEPERVMGLCLVGATARFVREDGDGGGWPEHVLRTMQARLRDDRERVLASFERRMFAPAEVELLGGWRRDKGHDGWSLPALAAGLDYLAAFRLTNDDPPAAPVSLLHGGRDVICPLPGAEHLARLLPHVHVTVWEGAGHVPFWTDRERFHGWLLSRLAA